MGFVLRATDRSIFPSPVLQEVAAEAEDAMESLQYRYERVLAEIYRRGGGDEEQRSQIDPIEYLRTRYVSVAFYNALQDEVRNLENLLYNYRTAGSGN